MFLEAVGVEEGEGVVGAVGVEVGARGVPQGIGGEPAAGGGGVVTVAEVGEGGLGVVALGTEKPRGGCAGGSTPRGVSDGGVVKEDDAASMVVGGDVRDVV